MIQFKKILIDDKSLINKIIKDKISGGLGDSIPYDILEYVDGPNEFYYINLVDGDRVVSSAIIDDTIEMFDESDAYYDEVRTAYENGIFTFDKSIIINGGNIARMNITNSFVFGQIDMSGGFINDSVINSDSRDNSISDSNITSSIIFLANGSTIYGSDVDKSYFDIYASAIHKSTLINSKIEGSYIDMKFSKLLQSECNSKQGVCLKGVKCRNGIKIISNTKKVELLNANLFCGVHIYDFDYVTKPDMITRGPLVIAPQWFYKERYNISISSFNDDDSNTRSLLDLQIYKTEYDDVFISGTIDTYMINETGESLSSGSVCTNAATFLRMYRGNSVVYRSIKNMLKDVLGRTYDEDIPMGTIVTVSGTRLQYDGLFYYSDEGKMSQVKDVKCEEALHPDILFIGYKSKETPSHTYMYDLGGCYVGYILSDEQLICDKNDSFKIDRTVDSFISKTTVDKFMLTQHRAGGMMFGCNEMHTKDVLQYISDDVSWRLRSKSPIMLTSVYLTQMTSGFNLKEMDEHLRNTRDGGYNINKIVFTKNVNSLLRCLNEELDRVNIKDHPMVITTFVPKKGVVISEDSFYGKNCFVEV